MDNISNHISYLEATSSITATQHNINNVPNAEQLKHMQLVALKIFEPVRNHFNIPLIVDSFIRVPELNKLVGGSKTSQHITGQAIDFKSSDKSKLTNRQIFDWINGNLEFDQLIGEFPNENGEFAWIHCSYAENNCRNQSLKSVIENGKTKYYPV
jgi:hypothetical protein